MVHGSWRERFARWRATRKSRGKSESKTRPSVYGPRGIDGAVRNEAEKEGCSCPMGPRCA